MAFVEKSGWPRLDGLFEPASSPRTALMRVLFLVVREVGRNDIDKKNLETCVGEVGGDATAHDTGSNDRGTTNRLMHDARI